MYLIRHPNDIFGLCLHRVGYPGTRHFSASGTRFQNFGKVEALVLCHADRGSRQAERVK